VGKAYKVLGRVEVAFDTSCLMGNHSVGKISRMDGGGGGSGLERDLNLVHANLREMFHLASCSDGIRNLRKSREFKACTNLESVRDGLV